MKIDVSYGKEARNKLPRKTRSALVLETVFNNLELNSREPQKSYNSFKGQLIKNYTSAKLQLSNSKLKFLRAIEAISNVNTTPTLNDICKKT